MIDPILEQRKADYMEWLYTESGRKCGTYTGLLEERKAQLIEADMECFPGMKLVPKNITKS